jgi:hypothetical protein
MSSCDDHETDAGGGGNDIYVERAFELLDHVVAGEINAQMRYLRNPDKHRNELISRRADLEALTQNCGAKRTIAALQGLHQVLLKHAKSKVSAVDADA